MSGPRVLVVATANPGKTIEIRALLPDVKVETLSDHPEIAMPPEDEETYAGNARLKAEHAARALDLPVLADDSGLSVDALGGMPGVRSARYAPGPDAARIAKLLGALAGVPAGRRTARFVCAMALAAPGRTTEIVEGVIEGRIAESPRGSNGFGYDPVFLVNGGPRTMADLDVAEKNQLSHRARAIRAMMPHLMALFERS
jgi:XTP/dITP diphosphohydrolase